MENHEIIRREDDNFTCSCGFEWKLDPDLQLAPGRSPMMQVDTAFKAHVAQLAQRNGMRFKDETGGYTGE